MWLDNQVLDLLAKGAEKNLFGYYTGDAGVWDKIVRAYESKGIGPHNRIACKSAVNVLIKVFNVLVMCNLSHCPFGGFRCVAWRGSNDTDPQH